MSISGLRGMLSSFISSAEMLANAAYPLSINDTDLQVSLLSQAVTSAARHINMTFPYGCSSLNRLEPLTCMEGS